MATIDYLPDDVLREIFKESPHCAMIIRAVCRRWHTLAPTHQTTLAALHWRNVNLMPVSNKPTFVELSVKYGLAGNIQHYCITKSEHICELAAKHGHLEVLKWAHFQGCPWDKYTCANAANSGHLEVLKWAHFQGCPWDEWTCAHAAESGHLEVLKWAHFQGCPWDKWTCAYAANSGHLEVLKWALANGCPWDECAFIYAVQRGHLEVLEWVRTNGCSWDHQLVYDWAAWYDQQCVLEWLATQN